MKQALIITSFGTSVPEARTSITAVEQALAAAAPGYLWGRAFTSPTIRQILSQRGEYIPSLTEALEQLRQDGVERVVIQPTHLLYGKEYDKLSAEAAAMADCFSALTVGRPLLSNSQDIQAFALALTKDHPAVENEAVVFMGHGTDHFANMAYPALQTALHLAGREDILIGTVEGWPGLEDLLRQLASGGPRRINLLPLMLVAGDHARTDMAVDWKGRLEQAGHRVSCRFTGLGELPWVQAMYKERLTDILSG